MKKFLIFITFVLIANLIFAGGYCSTCEWYYNGTSCRGSAHDEPDPPTHTCPSDSSRCHTKSKNCSGCSGTYRVANCSNCSKCSGCTQSHSKCNTCGAVCDDSHKYCSVCSAHTSHSVDNCTEANKVTGETDTVTTEEVTGPIDDVGPVVEATVPEVTAIDTPQLNGGDQVDDMEIPGSNPIQIIGSDSDANGDASLGETTDGGGVVTPTAEVLVQGADVNVGVATDLNSEVDVLNGEIEVEEVIVTENTNEYTDTEVTEIITGTTESVGAQAAVDQVDRDIVEYARSMGITDGSEDFVATTTEEAIVEIVEVEETATLDAGGEAIQDPVNIVTGANEFTVKDFSYKNLNSDFAIRRKYVSDNETSFSFGKSWLFNFDSRVIFGLNPSYDDDLIRNQAILDSVNSDINTIFNEVNGQYKVALDHASSAITSAITSETKINKLISALTEAETACRNIILKGASALSVESEDGISAIEYINEAIALAEKANTKAVTATGHYEDAITSYTEAINLAITAKNNAQNTINSIGRLRGQYEPEAAYLYQIYGTPRYKYIIAKNDLAVSYAKIRTAKSNLQNQRAQAVNDNKPQSLIDFIDGEIGKVAEVEQNYNNAVRDLEGANNPNSLKAKIDTAYNNASAALTTATQRYNTLIAKTNAVTGGDAGTTDVKLTNSSNLVNDLSVLLNNTDAKTGDSYYAIKQAIFDATQEASNSYNSAKLLLPEVYTKPAADADPSTYTNTILGKITYLNRLLAANDIVKQKAIDQKASIEAKKIVDRAYYDGLKVKYEEAVLNYTNYKKLAMVNEKRNVNNINLEGDQHFYNGYVKYINFEGISQLYKLVSEPDYASTSQLPNGEINYYPLGSDLEPVGHSKDKLRLNIDGSITVTKKDQTKYTYNYLGQLSQFNDRNNNVTNFNYSNGELSSVVDSLNRTTNFTYVNGKITKIVDPNLNEYVYQYTGDLLTKYIDPEKGEYNYIYTDGVMTRKESPDNGYIVFEYTTNVDGTVYFTRAIDSENNTWDTEFYPLENRTVGKERNGLVIDYTYDSKTKKTVSKYGNDGFKELNSYDDRGNLLSRIDSLNNEVSYQYDENDNVTRITKELGYAMDFAYNSDNTISYIVDFNNNKVDFFYDSKGNLTKKLYSNNTSEEYTYYDNGLVKTYKDFKGYITTYEYDSNGYVSKIINPGDVYSDIDYINDSMGNILQITNEEEFNTYYTYDDNGNVLTVKNHDGDFVEYKYNDSGDLKEFIDARRNKTIYDYDSRKNINKITLNDGLNEIIKEFTFNTEEAVETIIFPDKSVITNSYDLSGNLTQTYHDKLDIKTIYEYDLMGNVTKSIDGEKNEWIYTYDDLYRLETVTDPRGHIKTRSYDGNDNLTYIEENINNKTVRNNFYYDVMNRLTREVKTVNGIEINKGIDYEYDDNGNLIKKINEENYTINYFYDKRNRLISTLDSENRTRSFRYDKRSKLVSSTDYNNVETTYSYDSNGRRVSITDTYGASIVYSYDANGNVASIKDKNDNYQYFEYDKLNRVSKSYNSDANNSITAYEYDSMNNVCKIIRLSKLDNSILSTQSFEYDSLGKLLKSTNEGNKSKTFKYDKNGNLLEVVDEMQRKTIYTYDSLNRVETISNITGKVVTYSYDDQGNVNFVTDAKNEVYEYQYDELNRLIKEINRLGNSQSYTYDELGRVTGKTDFDNNSYVYNYDPVGNLLEEVQPNNNFKRFTYDGNGNLLTAVDNDSSLEFVYDDLNRLISTVDTNINQTVNYEYDFGGNRTGVKWLNDGREIKYNYGSRNELLSVTDNESKTTSFIYDELGREIERHLPNRSSIYKEYDPVGRLLSINNLDSYGRSIIGEAYIYNDAGQRVADVDDLGKMRTYSYDEVGRVSKVQYDFMSWKSANDFTERITNGLYPEYQGTGDINIPGTGIYPNTTNIADLVKTTSDVNNLMNEVRYNSDWVTDSNVGVPFKDYPDLTTEIQAQIVNAFDGVRGDAGSLDLYQEMWTETFSYDANSNLLSKANGWGHTDYSYDKGNRLIKAGNRSFNYDNNGNLISEGVGEIDSTYTYDYNNRVIDAFSGQGRFKSVSLDHDNGGVKYKYDALNRRNYRVEYGIDGVENVDSNKHYLHNGLSLDPLAEFVNFTAIYGESSYKAGIKPVTEYIRANNSVINQTELRASSRSVRASKKTYFVNDVLGSVIGETSSRGSLSTRFKYDAFGTSYSGKFTDLNKLGYNGKPMDPVTGIYNYGYRDYASQLARFTTIDPIRDGSNWYAYCNNDPINYIDPLGLCTDEPNEEGSYNGYYDGMTEHYTNMYPQPEPNLPKNVPGLEPVTDLEPSGVFNEDYTNTGSPYTNHEGVDWGVPIGTPIVSNVNGEVVQLTENSSSYGTYMIIQDSDDPRKFYLGAHFDEVNVDEGDNVTIGQEVALSGDTGIGPAHFHTSTSVVESESLEAPGGVKYSNGVVRVDMTVDPYDNSIKYEGGIKQ